MTHYSVPPGSRRNAKSMRSKMTEPELKLWNELRAHRLMGLSFRRQIPIDGKIVDFACPSKKLIIELDGSQHGEAADQSADAARDARLGELGWTVIRFWNDDVLRDIDNVCRHIVTVAGMSAVDAASQAYRGGEGTLQEHHP